MKEMLVLLVAFSASLASQAQKKSLTHSVYDGWKSAGERNISPDVKGKLKEIYLLQGTEDNNYWTDLWRNGIEYKNTNAYLLVTSQLKRLFKYLLAQREYQYY